MDRPARAALAFVAALLAAPGCARREDGPPAVRLFDLYRPENLEGPVRTAAPPRTEWGFGDRRGAPPGGGHQAGPGIALLPSERGALVGRATSAFPILRFSREPAPGDVDTVHAVEIEAAVDRGGDLAIGFREYPFVDLGREILKAREVPWRMTLPLLPGPERRTYTIPLRVSIKASDARHLLVRPTDVPGARFEIGSVRIVFRREHLASIESGRSFEGLSEVYRESLVSRAGETLRFVARLPPRPRLELGVGTLGPDPVDFEVGVRAPGASVETVVVRRTVASPHAWHDASVDLSAYAGREMELLLRVRSGEPGTPGLWGSPVLRRQGGAPPRRAEGRGPHEPPQGVILVLSESLRRDHLELYGYRRETMPALTRTARAFGTVVRNCVVQATWTKASVPSLLSGLYPTTHGVQDFAHRLPASATTLAEVYREAGYATLSLSSILFTGQYSNLHQGFEEVHEFGSLPDRASSKTAGVYVERLLDFVRAHRDTPFFALLHVADPHDPFKPKPPYDRLFADPACVDHEARARAVRDAIADPLLRRVGMPTAEDVANAGFDPEAYVACERNWYDGSIRGLDAGLERLLDGLAALGLDQRVLVAFTADHGEEFFEHGRMFHGQSVYAELTDVPLVFLTPGRKPARATVEATVESIDLMPTLLELSRLPRPPGLQGRSLVPLLHPAAGAEPWAERPAVSEKAAVTDPGTPPPRETESYALRTGPRKLIFNPQRFEGDPEHELYAPAEDPLDQRNRAPQEAGAIPPLFDELLAWHAAVRRARLAADADAARALRPDELERLRSLGYIQ